MKKFTHIDALYQVARSVAILNAEPLVPQHRKLFEPVTFRGTVKLHGCNAGIGLTADAITAQSRSRELALGDDNHGFALFLLGDAQAEAARKIETRIRRSHPNLSCEKLTLFGEWCGPGIQKGCGIHQMPERMFVLFAAVLGENERSRYLNTEGFIVGDEFAEARMYSILDAPTWELKIDFSDKASIEAAAAAATELTLHVERQCPWAAKFDDEGIGEGIVWKPMGKHWGNTDLFFKTKGAKHKVTSPKDRKTQVKVTPEELANAEAFVTFAVTENRLNQGLEFLQEHGHPMEMRSLGAFLKWLAGDVQREGAVELEANGLTWKAVAKQVNRKARDWFIKTLHSL